MQSEWRVEPENPPITWRLVRPDGSTWGSAVQHQGRLELQEIAAALNEREGLQARVAELEDALELVLPMAKGYAHTHDVRNNRAKVYLAERKLRREPIDDR